MLLRKHSLAVKLGQKDRNSLVVPAFALHDLLGVSESLCGVRIRMSHMPGGSNVADVFTKPRDVRLLADMFLSDVRSVSSDDDLCVSMSVDRVQEVAEDTAPSAEEACVLRACVDVPAERRPKRACGPPAGLTYGQSVVQRSA